MDQPQPATCNEEERTPTPISEAAAAEADDLAYDIWYAQTTPTDLCPTLADAICDEYEQGVW